MRRRTNTCQRSSEHYNAFAFGQMDWTCRDSQLLEKGGTFVESEGR
jgi:hypothetical protein